MPSDYIPPQVRRQREEAKATRERYVRLRDETKAVKETMERVHKDLNDEERKYDLPVTTCPSFAGGGALHPAYNDPDGEQIHRFLGPIMGTDPPSPADAEQARATIRRWRDEDPSFDEVLGGRMKLFTVADPTS